MVPNNQTGARFHRRCHHRHHPSLLHDNLFSSPFSVFFLYNKRDGDIYTYLLVFRNRYTPPKLNLTYNFLLNVSIFNTSTRYIYTRIDGGKFGFSCIATQFNEKKWNSIFQRFSAIECVYQILYIVSMTVFAASAAVATYI